METKESVYLRYEAYIFDLDGTLTNSKRGIVNSTCYALEKMGEPILDMDTLGLFLGPPLAESFMKHCGMTSEKAFKATELYRERYIPIGWLENAVYVGVRAMLRELKAQGAYLAVATGKPEHTSIDILRHFGLLQYFDAVAGPAPDDLHADKAKLIARVLPKGKRAVMVGDTVGDILGAQQMGIDSVAVLYGYGKSDGILAQKPTYALDTVARLQALFLGEEIKEKGLFVTVEGLDGCGKTTQLETVVQVLSDFGFPVYQTREPGGCPISEAIRDIVLAKKENGLTPTAEALLFAASRAQHVSQVILPKINAGQTVVCDRFVDSSIAYQGGGRQLGSDNVRAINAPAVAQCMPDITVYLKVDQKTSIARRKSASTPDRIEQQADAFFERTQRAYEQLILDEPDRFLVVDATGNIDAVKGLLTKGLARRLMDRGVL